MTLFTLSFHYPDSGTIKEYEHQTQSQVNYYITLASEVSERYGGVNVKAYVVPEASITSKIRDRQHLNKVERTQERSHLKLVVAH